MIRTIHITGTSDISVRIVMSRSGQVCIVDLYSATPVECLHACADGTFRFEVSLQFFFLNGDASHATSGVGRTDGDAGIKNKRW